jgi:hypothetical protein
MKGGCACAGGRRKTVKKHHRHRSHKKTMRGGNMIVNAAMAVGALGLYQYFVGSKSK